ncbi:MAG: sulfite exporter TauE/SafE family protein [Nitrospinae bacterium]|nr:sulfite exporter TauE/SafE family protein [Nitrospinota bacterium]
MDWLYMLFPISGVTIFWPGLVIIGFSVGVIGGFFGMGGAWMVTPGLNILGFPMAFAIGTDMAHIAGKSIISTIRHGKFGNVDYKLGMAMLGGTFIGIEVGAQMIMWFERIGKVDLYVRILYLIFLSFIAFMVFGDYFKKKKMARLAKEKGQEIDKLAMGITWYKTVHKMRIPPMMNFKMAGLRISLWIPIIVGFFTGWLAGILGIGGGLFRMPALIYFVGCPTHIAVGTDLFEVMLSGLYGAASYTWKGRTELVAAMIMLTGAAIGAQFGTVATKYVAGDRIRLPFGCAVICCGISIILKMLEKTFSMPILGHLSAVLILGAVSIICIMIITWMVKGAKKELAMKKGKE